MALWDKLKNLISNDEYVMRELQPLQEQPVIKGLQMKEDGTVYEIPTPTSDKQVTFGQRLSNALLGTPTRTIEAYDDQGKPIYSSGMVREGGAFRDITKGYNENVNQRFSPNNWGQDKNAMTRIGELLGTTARFADSPAGKMLLAYGASNMLGDTNPLEQALTAGVTNINAGNVDKIYRQDLANQGIDTSNIKGFINKDTYGNLINSKQLKDNADWRKMYFDTNQKNLEAQREWQRLQFQMQQDEKRADRAYKYAELGERRRQNDLNYQLGKGKLLADSSKGSGENLDDVEAQLNNFQNTFKTVDNPYRYRIAGGASEFLNTLTPDEANFNSQRTLLFNQIARKLGGEKGVLSDQDIKRIDAALPKLSDTKAQKEAKMKAVYDLLDIKKGNTKNDPLGIL